MALTSEQRAANGVAKLARDRAYRVRYKEFRDMEEQVEAEIKAKYEERILNLTEIYDAIEVDMAQSLGAINEEISALQERLNKTTLAFQSRLAEPRIERSGLYTLRNKQIRDRLQDIAAGFPDMVGQARWSAAMWKDYKDFL